MSACMQMHATSMHCGSQVAADCHLMHSSGHKNFAGRRSLEKLYGSMQQINQLARKLSYSASERMAPYHPRRSRLALKCHNLLSSVSSEENHIKRPGYKLDLYQLRFCDLPEKVACIEMCSVDHQAKKQFQGFISLPKMTSYLAQQVTAVKVVKKVVWLAFVPYQPRVSLFSKELSE